MPIVTGCARPGFHAYPQELVSFIFDLWANPLFVKRLRAVGIDPSVRLPDRAALQRIVSTCYQASLMQEEERPIRFRLIVCDPELFPAYSGPPSGLHPLHLVKTRPFNEYELHRLSPAADFFRTLIGVFFDRENEAQIWGIINSGTRWVEALHGGRKAFPPLPLCPVIYVTGPGRIAVCIGHEMIASLNGGQINYPFPDFYTAPWLAEIVASVRSETWERHAAARARAQKPWAILDPNFDMIIARQVVRRIISVIQNYRHGGMLVYLPPEISHDIVAENRYLAIKYRFHEDESRGRFSALIVDIMNTLAEIYGDQRQLERNVGWQEYVTTRNETIAYLDEAIIEMAHFIAALSAIDGAVVMTQRMDLLGFGGVIVGDVEKVETITRALDAEGKLIEPDISEGVGTRHRAAYLLCQELHDALVIVISQDGNVRIVKWHQGSVTYWDQAPNVLSGFR
jgi:hypothetical protein